MTIDIDTTVLNLWGHQEGAEKGYNDIKRGNRCYHPILAFVYETKEFLHGILKSGDSYCANGAVEFIKELKTMIPYGIYNIIFRADNGFFSQETLKYLENMKIKIVKLNTSSFWANQAILQFLILCYNMLVWFKNIFIGKSELKTTIRTFRERFLLIPGKLIKRTRQFILKLPIDFIYKEKLTSIEFQLA
jgi:hypothetical protein